jgi:hypothetical protein
MCLWAISIFPRSVYIFPSAEKADPSWEYIIRPQTHECGNWDWGHDIPFLGIFVSNFWYFVFAVYGIERRRVKLNDRQSRQQKPARQHLQYHIYNYNNPKLLAGFPFCTVIRFDSINAKFGICTVLGLNKTLVAVNIRTYCVPSAYFSFSNCPMTVQLPNLTLIETKRITVCTPKKNQRSSFSQCPINGEMFSS